MRTQDHMQEPSPLQLKGGDVTWCGSIFKDPAFRTFRFEDAYYKALLASSDSWAGKPGATAMLRLMHREGFIPETEPCDVSFEDFGPETHASPAMRQGFKTIFRQYSEFFNVPFQYICAESLREAAMLFLRFNLWLLKRNFGLLDAHGGNIVFQGAMRPLWCDLGSIVPLGPASTLLGLDEFTRFCLYPLLLRSRSYALSDCSRAQLGWQGISHDAAKALGIEMIQVPSEREPALRHLLTMIERLDFPHEKTTWSEYHPEEELELHEQGPQRSPSRHILLARMVKSIAPRTIIDLGANAGLFSRYLAPMCSEILAVEPDETAVLRHMDVLRQKTFNLPLKLMLAPAGVGPYRPAQLAVALALTHHLYFTAGYPWKYIASLLASYTTGSLITEFMPHGMYGAQTPPSLPENYRIEVFARQLERHFKDVRIVDYPRGEGSSPRIFLLCTEKRAEPESDGWGTLPLD